MRLDTREKTRHERRRKKKGKNKKKKEKKRSKHNMKEGERKKGENMRLDGKRVSKAGKEKWVKVSLVKVNKTSKRNETSVIIPLNMSRTPPCLPPTFHLPRHPFLIPYRHI